jgi:ABC-2 type transport system permease protein
MLKAVLRRTLKEMRRDGRVALALACGLLIAAVTVPIAALQNSREARDQTAAVEADRKIWLDQGRVGPHSSAHFGQYAFRPPAALGALDRGLYPYLGQAVWIEAHYQNPAEARPIESAGPLARFGDLSPAWALQIAVPLLIVLFGFSLVAGERVRGQLALQLALGARPRSLLLGKWLALASLGVLLIAPTLIAGGGVEIAGARNAADTAVRVACFSLLYLGWVGLWSALTIAGSAMVGAPRTVLIALLGFWAATAVIVPRLAADTAAQSSPLLPPGAFWDQVATGQKQGVDGHAPANERNARLMQETLAKYGVKKPADLPINFTGIALEAGEAHGAAVFDRLWGEQAKREDAQMWIVRTASLLSPALSVVALSAGFAGSDLLHQRAFTAAAEQHRRSIQTPLNMELAEKGKEEGFNYLADRALWERVATFGYHAPSFASVWRAYLPDFVWALAWIALASGMLALSARAMERRR